VGRALISQPDVVFADEPTGALDSRASTELLRFLRSVVDDLGQTVVMVTPDPGAAAYADRVVFLADGAIVEELARSGRPTVSWPCRPGPTSTPRAPNRWWVVDGTTAAPRTGISGRLDWHAVWEDSTHFLVDA
jgi:energy-coupling factor transporter ATP-binding protein EcfA2